MLSSILNILYPQETLIDPTEPLLYHLKQLGTLLCLYINVLQNDLLVL